MVHFIRQCEAYAAKHEAEQAAAIELNRKAEAMAARDRLRPLDQRLRDLLGSIPDDVKREGLSLATLAGMLRGRRGGTAQTGAVGAALRQAGWSRKRGWAEEEDGFRARWFPPGTA